MYIWYAFGCLFFKDDMSPWILSSIHIQRWVHKSCRRQNKKSFNHITALGILCTQQKRKKNFAKWRRHRFYARALAPFLPRPMPKLLPPRPRSPLTMRVLPIVSARGSFRPLSHAACLGCPAWPFMRLAVVVRERITTDSSRFRWLVSLAVLAAP